MESIITVAMWLYSSLVWAGENVSPLQRAETKKVENGLLRMSCNTPRGTKRTLPLSKEDNNLLCYFIFELTELLGRISDI